METQDVVIIGASLAGLMAARELSENFLVLDAKPRVGLPLKCGEAVEAHVLRDLFGDDIDEAPFVANRVLHHDVQFGEARRRLDFAYHELDRPAFEAWLAEPVAAQLRMNCRVRDIHRTPRGFRLATSTGEISTRAILLANGASYALQKSLGLVKKEPRLGYAWGGLFTGDIRADDSAFLWEPSAAAKGYAWAFPKGGGVWNVGVAGFDAKALRKEVARFGSSIGGTQNSSLGGHFPADGIVGKTYDEGVLVAGDAAGMVFAGTGEGIAYALQAGRLAGRTLARGDFSRNALARYEREWKKSFGRQLRAGVHFKRMLVFLLEKKKLERVMRAVPDAILHGMMVEGKIPLGVLARFAVSMFTA